MKRLFLILLAVLLLAGCGKKPEPVVPTESTPPVVEGVDYRYMKDSAVEEQTGGAVHQYRLDTDSYFGIAGMGSHILVMGNKGLTVLTGQWGEVLATLSTADVRATTVMDTAATGIAYYVPGSRQVVIRNPQLQEVTSLELPKEIVGMPCISLDRNEVFYSTGSEIRAMKMENGISRLIRQQSAVTQSLRSLHFDGKVLLCEFTDADGVVELEYISAETGQTLGRGENVMALETYQNRYFAFWQDGVVLQSAFGSRGNAAQSLFAPLPSADEGGGRAAVLEMNGAVDYVQTEGGLELSFYDFSTGKRTARKVLPGVGSPAGFLSDGSSIWMLATDTVNTCQALYRWDVKECATEDESVYISPLYTPENPDTEGLAQCKTMAGTFQTQYGVKVMFWEDAIAHTAGYSVTAEHHTQVIMDMMKEMEPLLSLFPEKFLLKTVEAGWIRIAIVQDIHGGPDWVQFWEGGDCWILVKSGTDVVSALIQGMAYGIDSHVLGNSRDFDTWSDLNPSGFKYSYSDKLQEDSKYLRPDYRAFTDAVAMNYPHEDRCRIFYHAMQPDNADMFKTTTMQKKLMRLCTGIREAYNLEKKTVEYAWEQYLNTSLAYVPEQ